MHETVVDPIIVLIHLPVLSLFSIQKNQIRLGPLQIRMGCGLKFGRIVVYKVISEDEDPSDLYIN